MSDFQGTSFSWKQVAAATGVILSLIFVGLELRNNTAAVTAGAFSDITALTNDWLLNVASNQELAGIYVRWRDGSDDLDAVDDARIRLLIFALLRSAENAYLQMETGVLDPVVLRGYGIANAPPFESPAFPPLWTEFRVRFHPEFVKAFEQSYGL